MASISYGILVCNEAVELNRLLGNLTAYLRPEDEIVVLVDGPKAPQAVADIITLWQRTCENLNCYRSEFNGNFAEWREELASHCTKDWIFQIDADELVDLDLLVHLPEIIESCEDVEVFALSRVNTVNGLTQEDIDKWHWDVHGRLVNWPDWQTRLYINDGSFHWTGEVHECLESAGRIIKGIRGLYHPKDIERQRRQNALYDTYHQ